MRLLALLAVVPLAALDAQASPPPSEITTYLRERAGFSEAEVAKVVRGEVVTRRLRGASDREVVLAGVARFRASPAAFIDQFREREPLLRSRQATQFGLFGRPPSADDLRSLVLPSDDIAALRDCAAGDCTLKLPAELIDRVQALDWSGPQVAPRVNELMREWLLEYVRGYLSRGNAALVVYGDRRTPLPLHEGLHALLAESPYLVEYVPEFHHYLDEFPARDLPGAEDVLYWSLEDSGLRPLTAVTHAVLYVPPSARDLRAIVALKRIYASHYFHAGLTLMMLVDDGDDQVPGFYLVYLDRMLFDTGLGGLKRRSVEGRLEGDLRQRLTALPRTLDREEQL